MVGATGGYIAVTGCVQLIGGIFFVISALLAEGSLRAGLAAGRLWIRSGPPLIGILDGVGA